MEHLLTPEMLSKPLEESPLPDTIIIDHLPKSLLSRTILLLNRLNARSDVISWDKSGQVKLEGVFIPHSNIIDLVSDALRARKGFNPVGSGEFFKVLHLINVPRDLARNNERWCMLDYPPDDPQSALRAASVKYFEDFLKKHRKEKEEKTDAPKRWF